MAGLLCQILGTTIGLQLLALFNTGLLLGFGINLDDILGFRQTPFWPQWPSIHLFSHPWKMVPFHCGLSWVCFKDLYINVFATFD